MPKGAGRSDSGNAVLTKWRVRADGKEIKLVLIEGDVRQEKVLSPGKVIDGVCQKGCIIRLNDDENDEYELDGSEIVSVEEGFLYYDSPQGEGAPQDGSAVSPVKKKSQ